MADIVRLVVLPDPYTTTWTQWVDNVTGYNPGLRDKIGRAHV